MRATKMAQPAKVLAAKRDDLSLIPRTYLVEGEKWPLCFVGKEMHVCTCTQFLKTYFNKNRI